ncbi:unnamed protein product [Effrenium voratum]|uniref:Hexose transporter 1 n=1 Tax=Effrenium voratum TaxID=2562239 RepID=A0AA36IB45_9DINO|nr:unnamed protein product [Effrenium voratum]
MSGNCTVIFASLLASLGAFLFGLDIGYIAPILECWSFKRDVAQLPDWEDPSSKIPSGTAGFVVGVFSIGCISVSFPLVSSYFLDTWGRKDSIQLGSLVFLLGCWVQARANSLFAICLGRLISGCAVGLLSTVVSLYQSELAPSHLRGNLTSLYQFMITLGILVAAAADIPLVGREDGWRYAIFLQVAPALVLLLGMFLLPRSPRWLVQRGRTEEALAVLQRLRDEAKAQEEFKEILASWQSSSGEGSWQDMSQRTRQLLAVGVALQLLQQLVGMNAFMYFGPRIFRILQLDENRLQALNNGVNCISTLPALFLADRCGRRSLLIWGASGMILACCTMGVLGITGPPGKEMGVKAQVWVYCAEIFPLQHRSKCVGLTTMSNWLGNFLIAQVSPVLLESLGFGSFFVFGFFSLAALLLACWLPETKGIALEDIQSLFDQKFGEPQAHKPAPAAHVLGNKTSGLI